MLVGHIKNKVVTSLIHQSNKSNKKKFGISERLILSHRPRYAEMKDMQVSVTKNSYTWLMFTPAW